MFVGTVLDMIQTLYSPYMNSKPLFLGWNFLVSILLFLPQDSGQAESENTTEEHGGSKRGFGCPFVKHRLDRLAPGDELRQCVCLYLSVHDADALGLDSAYRPSDIICVLRL